MAKRKSRSSKKARKLRAILCASQDYKCFYCGVVMEPIPPGHSGKLKPNHATIEHIHPVSRRGSDRPENCVAACNECNLFARDAPPDQKMEAIRKHKAIPVLIAS